MLAVFISVIRNCNGFNVEDNEVPVKETNWTGFELERQYNFLGFDLNMPSGPKSYRDFLTRVLQKIRCSFTTSILVKITQIIWRSICIQMDFYINFAYFTWVKMYPDRRFCPFPFILPPHPHPHPHPPLLIYPPKQNLSRQALDIAGSNQKLAGRETCFYYFSRMMAVKIIIVKPPR